jgi:hypothetical protein
VELNAYGNEDLRMEIPDDVFHSTLEQMRQILIGLRTVRAELGKWRQEPVESTVQAQPAVPVETESIEPPTEKQIQFLRGLGIEEIPASKEEARRLLQELNEKREQGEYSIPPTAKQLKFLKDLKYAGPMPETKEAAWQLLQELKKD